MKPFDEIAAILKQDLPTLKCGPVYAEYEFAEGRKFHADFALPLVKVLVEVEGGIFPFRDEQEKKRAFGAHRGIKRMLSDMEKYNLAQSLGFRVYRFTPEQVKNGDAMDFLKKALR